MKASGRRKSPRKQSNDAKHPPEEQAAAASVASTAINDPKALTNNNGGVTVQYIPIAVSQSQPTNAKGRTVCKVIGCHRVDYPDTHGYCTQHYGLFFPPVDTHLPREDADVMNHRQSTDGNDVGNDNSDDWLCSCGMTMSSEKRRCKSCSKWRGGGGKRRRSNKDGGRRKASSNQIAPSQVLDVSAMPQLPPLPANAANNDVETLAQNDAELFVPELPPINLPKNRTRGSKRRRASQSLSVNDSTITSGSYSYPLFDLDITKVKIAKECAYCWEALLSARKVQQQREFPKSTTTTHNNNYASDPFDCSDLIVPPSTEIIEREVSNAIQRWVDLDSRMVFDEEDDKGNNVDENQELSAVRTDNNSSMIIMDGTMVGDGRKQRLLPPNFDYKCASMPGVDPNNDDQEQDEQQQQQQQHYRPRVISLLDPTQTLDYETELWHVFKSMPTAADVERKHGITLEAMDDETQNNNTPIDTHGLQHTLQLKEDYDALIGKHTRMDAHSLGRLRMRDAHTFPSSLLLLQSSDLHSGGTNPLLQSDKTLSRLETTIRFEVLRYSDNLKRGSSRDCNRLEVELSGSRHTLLDLHRVLVECASWDSNKDATAANTSTCGGVFFIENKFYTHGETGENAKLSILQWLDGYQSENKDKSNDDVDPAARREHLCISSSISSTEMSNTHLENVPLRLGIRYVHIFIDQSSLQSHKINLRNESAFFVTDIQTHKRPNVVFQSPIIHDKWTPAKSTTFCSACTSAVASVITMDDPLTSTLSEGTPLCAVCFRGLHYEQHTDENELLQLRQGSVHQSFRVLPVDTFHKLTLEKEMEEIPGNATFNRF
eukprot:scaffold16648_cov51-Cyclotella_meneghiniana.AAC.3